MTTSPDHHNFVLNTARSKITVDITPSSQLLSVAADKQDVSIFTEIINGAIHVRILEGEKEVFSGLLLDMLRDLDTTRALKGIKHLVSLTAGPTLNEQQHHDQNALRYFLTQ